MEIPGLLTPRRAPRLPAHPGISWVKSTRWGWVDQGPALGPAAQGLPADVVEQGDTCPRQHCREKPWLTLEAHRPRGSRARAQGGSAAPNPSGSRSQRRAATAVSCAQARPCGRDVTAHELTQAA